jgi:hypothetical protein
VNRLEHLRARKSELLDIAEAQRRELSLDLGAVEHAAGRVDGWLSVARRLTPVAAAGLALVTVLAGPARVLRLVRGSVVPALLLKQLISRRR